MRFPPLFIKKPQGGHRRKPTWIKIQVWRKIMKKILLFTLVFVFVLGTFNAFAQRRAIELTPFAGYRLGGSFDVEGLDFTNFDFKDGFTYGVSLGFSVHENLQVEIKKWGQARMEKKMRFKKNMI
jgi:hypothetical protein